MEANKISEMEMQGKAILLHFLVSELVLLKKPCLSFSVAYDDKDYQVSCANTTKKLILTKRVKNNTSISRNSI